MSAPNPDYALGRSPREYARLALQSEILKPLTRHVFEDAGIAPGMRVLDLGSGAGDVCMLLSEMVGPSGTVIGLDVDAATVEHARRRAAEASLSNITFTHCDLAHYRPDAPIDALVGRFVLCYLPDPSAPLAALSKSVRPGGIVAFQEPWMTPGMGPEGVVKRLATCVFETFRRSGAHVDIGPRLHRVFTDAGLPQPAMRFEAVMDGRPDSPLYQYAAESLASLLPKAVEYGVVAAEDFDIGTLAARLSTEQQSQGYAMKSQSFVAAWCRIPD
jgi:ubiquinone/menaquinone biosynthesis C-methylase UbiE